MRATWLVLTVSSLVLCVGLLPASPVAQEKDVEASGEISGLVEAKNFVVPYDAVVRVTDDTIIQATGDVEINGVLLVVDRQAGGEELDAPALTIQTPEALIVRGAIIGGRGVPGREGWDGARGGDGSSINLIAGRLHTFGLVKGGPGAPGGTGGAGGKGGDVVFSGAPDQPRPDPHHDLRNVLGGGPGGKGGSGGTGGNGGSVRPR